MDAVRTRGRHGRVIALWVVFAVALVRRATWSATARAVHGPPPDITPFWSKARFKVVAIALVLAGCAVGFGLAGYFYRPSDSGPPQKPSNALQLVDLVLDRPETAAAVRLSLDSTGPNSSYVQLTLGIDTPPTSDVAWAVVLSFDGVVSLSETSAEPAPISVRSVLPEQVPRQSTYLIEGKIGRGSLGYSSLRNDAMTQFIGADVYPFDLTAQGVQAAAYDGPYISIPVAVGLSDDLRSSGLAALAPDPQRFLRALDSDSLGWTPFAARSAVEYQSNVVPGSYVPDGVLPPQSAATAWYWNLRDVPRSSVNYSTARSPSLVARDQQHVFWSGVFLALAGSALIAIVPLALAWPGRSSAKS